MHSRLRILSAFGLVGIGPGSVHEAGVESAYLQVVSSRRDPKVVVVETVRKQTRLISSTFSGLSAMLRRVVSVSFSGGVIVLLASPMCILLTLKCRIVLNPSKENLKIGCFR